MEKVAIPLSIVGAGLIIAGAVFFTKTADNIKPTVIENEKPQLEIRAITDGDHIRGNPDAPLLIVEYSDLECPACAIFHGTMKRIMDDYISTGKVAWVYRHAPLESIHDNARPSAEASECIAKLGGEDKFWQFIDQVFANQTENLKPEKISEIAVSFGIDKKEFDNCLSNKETKDRVDLDANDVNTIAKVTGEFGTPYNIFIPKNAQQFPIIGAPKYNELIQIINELVIEKTSGN